MIFDLRGRTSENAILYLKHSTPGAARGLGRHCPLSGPLPQEMRGRATLGPLPRCEGDKKAAYAYPGTALYPCGCCYFFYYESAGSWIRFQ